MRLFTGLEVPPRVETELERFLQVLREAGPGFRWSPLANLHITTQFIGEFGEARLPELKQALQNLSLTTTGPLTIAARGVGWFPNANQPWSMFASVDQAPWLTALASSTQDALASLSVKREEREYTPHITLAKLNRASVADLVAVKQAIASYDSLDFGGFEAKSFFLYLSRTESTGSIYTKLAEFPIQ
jgi:RNA 2',3'-cyclic 3'-phosphodiesterase